MQSRIVNVVYYLSPRGRSDLCLPLPAVGVGIIIMITMVIINVVIIIIIIIQYLRVVIGCGRFVSWFYIYKIPFTALVREVVAG